MISYVHDYFHIYFLVCVNIYAQQDKTQIHVIELQSSTNLMELGIFYSQAMIPTFP